jgi:ribose/xylose/arabinose/galactoside ABC-type transport system permease subunit
MIRVRQQYVPLIMTAGICAALYATACIRYDHFFSLQVFLDLFRGNAPLGLAAIGMTFVILSGGIDLSVGSMVGFTGVLLVTLTQKYHWPAAGAMAAALALGAGIGAAMGCLIQFGGLAPFLVTLAGMFLVRGAGLWVSAVASNLTGAVYGWLSDAGFERGEFFVSATVVVLAVAFCIAAIVSTFTRFGRNVYAIGGNEQSAILMGLPVARTKVLVYAVSGFCSALAGIVFAISLGSGDASAGNGMELDAIAAVVIGGTLISGGVGGIGGTVIGLLIVSIIQTAITTYEGSLDSAWTKIVTGALLLVFILLQKLLTRSAGRS